MFYQVLPQHVAILNFHVIQIFNRENFFVESCHQEFIFEEQDLFEISENKNPSKIKRYMVVIDTDYH